MYYIFINDGRGQARGQKKTIIENLYELFGTHKQIILTTFTNVGSYQIQQIRKDLRAYNSILVISKNTLIKKVVKMRSQGIDQEYFRYLEQQFGGKVPGLKALTPLLKQNDASVFDLKGKIEANKVPTEARIDVISPIDFICPAGPTGLDPSQINFFHALNISTKIVKGQIQITKDFNVCTKGKKIKASQAALLKKLNIKPFEYGMKIFKVYDEGSILPEELIALDPASLLPKFQSAIRNIAGLSLSAGYPIAATIPFIISQAFRNIAALSIESNYKIKQTDALTIPIAAKAEVHLQVKKQSAKNEYHLKERPKESDQEIDIDIGPFFFD